MSIKLIIFGKNFSGRSESLIQLAKQVPSFYMGPYNDSSITGYTLTCHEEISLYGNPDRLPSCISGLYKEFISTKDRISSLSGGEQVILSLTCSALSTYNQVVIDTSLEQLDYINREKVLAYLINSTKEYILIDNRFTSHPDLVATKHCRHDHKSFELQEDFIQNIQENPNAPSIEINNLSFGYSNNDLLFDRASAKLAPGEIYRIEGNNGVGKSTLAKILTGCIRTLNTPLSLNGNAYSPWKHGNLIISYSMQNPDDQWIAGTIRDDFLTRSKFSPNASKMNIDSSFNNMISFFGINEESNKHILDLPKALRKRLSWSWCLFGGMPWIALDEPTIGQDVNTKETLANALAHLKEKGYGIILISHDDIFLSMFSYNSIDINNKKIALRK